MKSAKLWAMAILSIGISLNAQTAPNFENGWKPYGSYDGSHLDTVNLMNGNLMLHAPIIPTTSQRGAVSPGFILYSSSKDWQTVCTPNPSLPGGMMCAWKNGGAGLGLQSTVGVAVHRTLEVLPAGIGGNTTYRAFGYSLVSADGASHRLIGVAGTEDASGVQTKYDAIDLTGYHLEMSNPDEDGILSTFTVTDRHGNQYSGNNFITRLPCPRPPANKLPTIGGHAAIIDDTSIDAQTCSQNALTTLIVDSNGNQIVSGMDTLGRLPQFSASGPAVNPLDSTGCVSSHPFFSSSVMYYNAPDGSTQSVKVCFSELTVHTAFNQVTSGVAIGEFDSTLHPEGSLGITTLILADGTKWTFDYDNYGELTFIGLPTGGSIAYTWTTINFAPCDAPNFTKVSRAVATRTLNDGQGHTQLWQYNWGTATSAGLTNVVKDPLLNDTVHVFTPQAPAAYTGTPGCFLYESSTVAYQGAQSANHPLQRVDTTYSSSIFSTSGGIGASTGNVFATDILTTVYPSGKVKKVHKDPDAGLGAGLPIFGNVKTELEYDWGPGQPGALLRETDTAYQWETNPAYLTAHLLDLPATVIVRDGSGNRIAETDYSYDEPAYLTTPTPAITPQHGAPPYGVRGNQTTASRWLNTTNSLVSSHTKWYDTGEVYKTVDPLGHETTHSYDPAYVGAYATQTCSPQTGATTHCVSGTYDFNTGVLTSLTNENATTQAIGNTQGDSAHTSNYSYDYMFRITSAQAPPDPDPANGSARAQTGFNFSPPNVFPVSVQRTRSITNALSDSATSFFDGLGRGYKGQHVLPNGTATVDTTFDLAGHAATVSNPYFTTSDPTYGNTTNIYDALDRVTQTTKQDGSISSVAYNVAVSATGDCTQTMDEAGKQRRACVDGLGRLIEVDETGDTFAGSQAGGSFNVGGALQSGSRATGSVTIQGVEQSISVFTPGGEVCNPGMICDGGGGGAASNLYDFGTVTITINGHAYSYTFTGSDTAVDTTATVASGLAAAINADTSAVVTASASGAIVSLTAKAPGPGGNYSLASSHTWDISDFAAASFTTVNSGAALTGGSNSGGVYDAGTMTVSIGAFTANVPYGNTGNSTGAQVASALATALSVSSSPVTASASGATVSLTWKSIGTTGNVTANCSSSTSQGANFLGPSFSCPASTGLTGGFNPQSPSLDHAFYATLYFYDGLGNLVCVEQHGNVAGTGCSASPTADASSPWRVRRFTYDSFSRLLTAKNPESGTITYLYDNDGELLQKTSPAPNQTGAATQTVSYCYDELHRVTGRGYGAQSCPLATPVVTYAYDSGANAKGHLTSMTDQAGTATYGYDILGRLTTETRTLVGANNAAVSKSIAYSYNLDGSVKTLTYPSGKIITYTPDSAGRTLSAIDSVSGINYVTGATYGTDSGLTGFVSGNSGTFAGITNAFSYNKRLQPLAMSATAPSQTVYSIGYDFHAGNGTPGTGTDNGNVWGIANNKDTTHGRDQSFTYDALNRLSSAQNTGTNCSVTVLQNKTEYWGNSYVYDAWGNLLQKIVTKCGAEPLTVTADAHNWIHATGAPDYLYDAAGNMTFNATPPTQTYTYDQENRLTGAAGYTYTYDGDGNRVRKSNGNLAANGTLYWEMTPGVVAETDLAGTLKSEYVFFDGERVARRDGATGAGGVFYYFSDHLKTASVITDSAGVIKAESDYYPWGGELQFVNNDPNDYKFNGKKNDLETGLYYFGARYYSNGLGRWVSADWSATPVPVPYADFGDPQTLNLYGFVGGNPASKADPDGHADDDKSLWQQFLDALSSIHETLKHMPPPNRVGPLYTQCTCPPPSQQDNKKQNNNNSQSSNTAEQGRDAQGKFLPKNGGEAVPGAAAEREALEAAGATKNTEAIPGSSRIPDGTIKNAAGKVEQYVEGKSGAAVSNTAQLRQMARAAVKETGKPLKLVTTNPNVKIAKTVLSNKNIEIVRLNQK